MTLDTLGIGHSYQHRMLHELNLPDQDVLDYNMAKHVAVKLGIDDIITSHYVLTRRYMVNDLFDAQTLNLIHSLRPSIITVNTISNDLAHLSHVDPASVTALAARAFEFVDAAGAPLTVFNACLPRTQNISSSPDVFRQNALKYNQVMHEFCTPSNVTHYTYFNPISGFVNHEIQVLDPEKGVYYKQQAPLPVSYWSNDGIHISEPAYFTKYLKRYAFGMIKKVGLLYN